MKLCSSYSFSWFFPLGSKTKRAVKSMEVKLEVNAKASIVGFFRLRSKTLRSFRGCWASFSAQAWWSDRAHQPSLGPTARYDTFHELPPGKILKPSEPLFFKYIRLRMSYDIRRRNVDWKFQWRSMRNLLRRGTKVLYMLSPAPVKTRPWYHAHQSFLRAFASAFLLK